jgi:hypothetical protein
MTGKTNEAFSATPGKYQGVIARQIIPYEKSYIQCEEKPIQYQKSPTLWVIFNIKDLAHQNRQVLHIKMAHIQ